MAFTTLNALISLLELKSKFQSSDAERPDFQSAIEGAVSQHNSSYVVSASSCTVPEKEKLAVVLLAWADLATTLASQKAMEPSGSGPSGFTTDRDTPFYKLTTLAKKLKEQYVELCKSLGLENYASSGSVHQSEVTVESLDLGAQAPFEMSGVPSSVPLTSSPSNQVNADGSIVLSWAEFKDFQNFAQYSVYHLSGSTAIYQEWNYGSALAPRINPSATLIGSITRMDCKSVQLTGLSITPGTVHRFLLMVYTKSGKHAYSTELVITQP